MKQTINHSKMEQALKQGRQERSKQFNYFASKIARKLSNLVHPPQQMGNGIASIWDDLASMFKKPVS